MSGPSWLARPVRARARLQAQARLPQQIMIVSLPIGLQRRVDEPGPAAEAGCAGWVLAWWFCWASGSCRRSCAPCREIRRGPLAPATADPVEWAKRAHMAAPADTVAMVVTDLELAAVASSPA